MLFLVTNDNANHGTTNSSSASSRMEEARNHFHIASTSTVSEDSSLLGDGSNNSDTKKRRFVSTTESSSLFMFPYRDNVLHLLPNKVIIIRIGLLCLGIIIGMILSNFGSSSTTTNTTNQPKEEDNKDSRRKHDNNDEDDDDYGLFRTSRQYSHTQTIGYQIYVGGAPAFINVTKYHSTNNSLYNDTIRNPECFQYERYGLLGSYTDPEAAFYCYVGHEDPIYDAKERIRIMKDAVERAYTIATNDTGTLKIFIAPEFFFRGIDGAYMFNGNMSSNCGPICHILNSLQDMVADKRFQDWLFVFGTTIGYEEIDTNNTTDMYDDDKYVFYNFAPIYKGYDPDVTNHTGKRFLLPKRYTSGLDFLTPARNIDPRVTIELIDQTLPINNETLFNPLLADITRYNNTIDFARFHHYKHDVEIVHGYTMIEYDWIVIDGITFTIEICLDHYRGTALQSYLADIVKGSKTRIPKLHNNTLSFVPIPIHQAQVSIVSSAGMTINPDSIALTDGGTIYLQDGLYNDPPAIIWSTNVKDPHLMQIKSVEGGTEAIERRAVLTETDVLFQYYVVMEYSKLPVYPNEPNDNDEARNAKTNKKKNHSSWQHALNGTFSIHKHEPMLIVYDPRPVPLVY